MNTLAGFEVFDLNNSATPMAYSVDGVDAEPAVADEPRLHFLSHWTLPPSSVPKETHGHHGSLIRLQFQYNMKAATNL
jgi:hypothetical protein